MVDIDIGLLKIGVKFLEELEKGKAKRFHHFENLKNKKTGKQFSPTTVSKQLRNLKALGLIRADTVEDHGRAYVGYKITDKGKEFLILARKINSILNNSE